MRRSRLLRFVWLAAPAALLLLAVLYELGGKPPGTALERLSEDYFPADPKLERTLSSWGGSHGGLAPLGVDGLSIEMLVHETEWADMRREELVDVFRETERETLLRFAGGPAVRGSYRVRGGSSILSAFRNKTPERLNFNIRLGRSLAFAPGVELRRFFLQNLADDRLKFHTRTAYILLQQIGLFHCYNRFVSLTVNATPVGGYLLVERPESAIRRRFPEVRLIVRRARPGRPAYTELFRPAAGPGASHHERLERALGELRGEDLVAELRRVIDLDGYLRWLAFNSFVKNADSFDEIFFFQVPSPGRPHGVLRVMAWDYDDLQARRPAHPERALRDLLLFGAEDELDLAVQTEPLLYARFQQIYRRLLEEALTAERLSEVLAQVEQELAPIDLGWPAGRDRRFRARRAQAIRNFEIWLLERRAALLAHLPADDGAG